jgi:hypothetical protein
VTPRKPDLAIVLIVVPTAEDVAVEVAAEDVVAAADTTDGVGMVGLRVTNA